MATEAVGGLFDIESGGTLSWRPEEFPELEDFLQPTLVKDTASTDRLSLKQSCLEKLSSLEAQLSTKQHDYEASIPEMSQDTTILPKPVPLIQGYHEEASKSLPTAFTPTAASGFDHLDSHYNTRNATCDHQSESAYHSFSSYAYTPSTTKLHSTTCGMPRPSVSQLQSALNCDSSSVPFTLLGTVKQEPQMETNQPPLTVRTSLLQIRFLVLQSSNSKKVTELNTFYCMQAGDMESARYRALRDSAMAPWQHAGINSYHDHIHHELLNRVEKSLECLEAHAASLSTRKQKASPYRTSPQASDGTGMPMASGTSGQTPVSPAMSPQADVHRTAPQMSTCQTPTHSSPVSETSKSPLNSFSLAVQIMTNWYERNKEHPYPSYDTCQVIARAGNITVEQVKKWFANHRNRSGNTKTIQEIAKRRVSNKRQRSDSCDFMQLASKKHRQ